MPKRQKEDSEGEEFDLAEMSDEEIDLVDEDEKPKKKKPAAKKAAGGKKKAEGKRVWEVIKNHQLLKFQSIAILIYGLIRCRRFGWRWKTEEA